MTKNTLTCKIIELRDTGTVAFASIAVHSVSVWSWFSLSAISALVVLCFGLVHSFVLLEAFFFRVCL
jgi:hypothetical protein